MRKYLTYKPDDIHAYLLLAKTLVRLDRDTEAIEILVQTIERFPTNYQARKLREDIKFNLHRMSEQSQANIRAWSSYEGIEPPKEMFVLSDIWFEPYGGTIP